MPFVVAGFPSPNTLAETLQSLQKVGSSIVEIGIPFSDPIADGPPSVGGPPGGGTGPRRQGQPDLPPAQLGKVQGKKIGKHIYEL